MDWTDPSHALHLLGASPEEGGLIHASLHIVKNSGHHLYADNPQGTVEKILEETHGPQVSQDYVNKIPTSNSTK